MAAQRSSYWRQTGFAWLDLALCTTIILALRFLVLQHFVWFQRFNAEHTFWAQLAELVGVSRKTINTVENGVFVPSVQLALVLARKLGTTVATLFYLVGVREK